MIQEAELTKLYYTIGEVANMFNVNTSLIRFWENEFPSIKPKKNKKGNRLFSPKSIMEIQHIYELVKKEGYTLEGAKKALRQGEASNTPAESMEDIERKIIIQRLENIRERLLALK
ncbi:MAG: MerR family transcriptional regulator [Brumimicrobium sp.]|nr:MerR family transcriptional regulator [Brumimicrobium sp.]MCO5267727.1 MerR family transcriptional regulator [Brumimicrobium sp.]